MRIQIDVIGEGHVVEKMEDWAEAAKDMRPALKDVQSDFYNLSRARFASEGSGLWPQLADSTVKKRGSAHPILVDDGSLLASLTRAHAKGSRSHVGVDELVLKSVIPHAHLHQSGTKKMPRRAPVAITGTDRRRWVDILQRFLTKKSS